MNALQLLDLVRIDSERGHENGIDIAANRQVGEELMTVCGGIDVLEQRDVIAGRMHHRFDARERLRIEPAGDLLIHQHRHTVGLSGLQGGGGAGDVEIELIGHIQHLAVGLRRDEFRAGEGARHCRNGDSGLLGYLVDVCLAHVPPRAIRGISYAT